MKLLPSLADIPLTDRLIAGFIIVNAAGSLYAVFLPLSTVFILFLLAISLLWLVLNFGKVSAQSFALQSKQVAFIPVILMIAWLASDRTVNYDSGLYHIQAISWMEAYPAVPGLGNLHGRLAFNPNVFVMMAAFSLRPLIGQHVFAVNAFLMIIFAYHLYSGWENRNQRSFNGLLIQTAIAMPAIFFALRDIASPNPDGTVMLLSVFLFLRIIDNESRGKTSVGAQNNQLVIMAAMIAVYILTVKISNGVILLLPFILFITKDYKLVRKEVVLLLCLLAFLVIPWLVRNYILSGYLIYPILQTAIFNPDWQVLPLQVMAENQWIRSWARLPGNPVDYVLGLKPTEWLPLWFNRMHWAYLVLIVPALFSPLAGIVLWASVIGKKSPISMMYLLTWAVAYVGTLVWMIWLPEPRFGLGFIMMSNVLWVALFLHVLRPMVNKIKPSAERYWRVLLIASCVIMISGFTRISSGNIAGTRILMPHGVHNAYRTGQDYSIRYEEVSINGLLVTVPMNDDRCFDQPLPCSPYVSETLQLRGKTLRQGFSMHHTAYSFHGK